MPGQLPENTMNTPEYHQPTHREELERELVHAAGGAACGTAGVVELVGLVCG